LRRKTHKSGKNASF